MLKPRIILTLTLTLLVLQAAVCSAKEPSRMSTEERIIRLLNITSGYYKVAAPPPDNGTANVIKFRTVLIRISNVDVVNQLVSLDLWIRMFWTDSRLAWNETDDPKLAKFEKIFLPTDYVWLPDLSLSHPVDVKSFETNKFLVDVSSNGRMKLEMPLGITIKCPLKMRDFPFDNQVCQFSFSSAAKKQTLLQLEIKSGLPINYSEINLQNNEYCVTSVRSVIIDFSTQFPQFKKLLVTVEFERRPLYYIIVLIIPSALILATCIFGFLLPADSGDRLALNVAILLSMSVFLQLAGSITPAQSESVPVLTWYFTVAMAVTALSTIGSIVVHLCYRRAASREAVSNPALRLLFLNRLCGWSNSRVSSATSKAAAASPSSSSLASVQDGCRDPGDEWLHVSCVLDRLMLVCVVSLSVAVTVLLGATANKSN